MTTRLLTHVIIGLAVLSLGIPTFFVSAAETPSTIRWALVASQTDKQKALVDLLTSKLSSDFSLVERNDVQAALNEMKLAGLFGEKAVETRLQLGKILKADRLVVLAEPNKLFVLDTKFGLTLFQSTVEVEGGDLKRTCDAVAVLLKTVNRRYADGIKAVVAVSYFVSKSFDRSFDYLQRELPDLLTRSLLLRDGVAVVTFEEIDHILLEHALTGAGSVKNRLVAFKVSGEIVAEMKTNVQDREKPQLFSLKIDLKDVETTLETFEQNGVIAAELGPFLATRVAQGILNRTDSSNGKTSFDAAEQKKQFLKDAAALDAVGAWELALRMRKAVFLLDPDDLDNTVDILLGPCLTIGWTSLHPARIKDRYESLPYLEKALSSKNLKLMHGLQLIYTVIETTGPKVIYDDENLMPVRLEPLADDPLKIGNDVLFLRRLLSRRWV